jgi:hypothetical protein
MRFEEREEYEDFIRSWGYDLNRWVEMLSQNGTCTEHVVKGLQNGLLQFISELQEIDLLPPPTEVYVLDVIAEESIVEDIPATVFVVHADAVAVVRNGTERPAN